MESVFNKKSTLIKRKSLRKNMTDAERILWSKIRNNQLGGIKFFRQFGIGEYIVDFYSPKMKLVIEIDGGQHFTDEGKGYDAIREDYMNQIGLITIRFSNNEVLTKLEGVIQNILDIIERPRAPHAPSL